jgi:hypothetical protein
MTLTPGEPSAHAPDTEITVRSDDVVMYVVSDVRPPLS